MNINIDDVIDFKFGKYLVLDVIKNKENTYLYLINDDEYQNDIAITKVINENGENVYIPIENDEEFDYVLNKIFMDFKEDILELMSTE